MGFEEYTVLTVPKGDCTRFMGRKPNVLADLLKEVQADWPDIHVDGIEIADLQYPLSSNHLFLVYETQEGLFQVLAMSNEEGTAFQASIRFAYCNPVTVYEPFCKFVVWLMTKWGVSCRLMRALSPEQTVVSRTVDDPTLVRCVLIPSMNYNRHLWHLDFGSEEAILRPGDAIERFVSPYLVPLEPVPEIISTESQP